MKYSQIFSKKTWILVGALMILSFSSFLRIAVETPSSDAAEGDSKVAWMYMFVTGAVQGDIEGEVETAGKEGWIEVLGYHHQVSNAESRSKHHSPLRVVKYIDKTSPKLAQACLTYETLSDVIIEFWKVNTVGTMVHWYTITLQNAHIINLEISGNSETEPTEIVSMTYERITWYDVDSNFEYTDDLEGGIA